MVSNPIHPYYYIQIAYYTTSRQQRLEQQIRIWITRFEDRINYFKLELFFKFQLIYQVVGGDWKVVGVDGIRWHESYDSRGGNYDPIKLM